MKIVNITMKKNSWPVVIVRKVVCLKKKRKRKYLVAIEGKHPSLSRMNQIVVQNLDGIAIEIVNLVFVEIVKIGLNVMVAIQ